MIEHKTGNLLATDSEALINTVNTVGVMGKGIALQFKKAFPENYETYKKACDNKEVVPGHMFIVNRNSLTNPHYIINFPTKRHWKGKSKIEDVANGLVSLVEDVKRLGIKTVAVPPLGCGLGGLPWDQVYPLMKQAFDKAPDVNWLVFEPTGAPKPKDMPNKTQRPRMTKGRAAVLGLIDRYLVPGYDYPISLLEIQKLVYFLTESGEHLNQVVFEKAAYGPYADVLRHVLEKIDGHFVNGYGDGKNKPDVSINLFPDAAKEAEEFIRSHSDTQSRFDKVVKLIEGFETPYGMELLSTVHWVATRENYSAKDDYKIALTEIKKWNTRKANLMQPSHIEAAWKRLKEQDWFSLTATL
jgi:O-acetyl-ADP-ribose deacetylase (regulator of RNase III)